MIEPKALLLALADAKLASGSALARHFGVSRAAIWKQIEVLRAHGAQISASAGSGYRLQAPVDLLDADAIRAELRGAARDQLRELVVHWQIDSTNSELLRCAQRGDAGPGACLAEWQSAGRGRRGRSWHSPLGGGIALSLWRRFDKGMTAMAGLSLAVGISVVRALESLGIEGAGLKWPNDVQHAGRKLAGVLIELGGDALGPCHAVIGIGLNLRMDARAEAVIEQAWTDLATITRAPLPNRNVLAACLISHLFEMLGQFEKSSFASFVEDYACYDVLRGQRVQISNGHSEREGLAVGVDQAGALRVQTTDGEIRVDSGEVSVRARAGTVR